jgi:alkanesulfonate monooxygenase SsuD/methylene tetrahydromethanopterin reductase-like flavin-dependent oxidoreductase (luciferase family)
MLSRNLMFGTPDEVIAKLKLYQAMGVDDFIYYASRWALGWQGTEALAGAVLQVSHPGLPLRLP